MSCSAADAMDELACIPGEYNGTTIVEVGVTSVAGVMKMGCCSLGIVATSTVFCLLTRFSGGTGASCGSDDVGNIAVSNGVDVVVDATFFRLGVMVTGAIETTAGSVTCVVVVNCGAGVCAVVDSWCLFVLLEDVDGQLDVST